MLSIVSNGSSHHALQADQQDWWVAGLTGSTVRWMMGQHDWVAGAAGRYGTEVWQPLGGRGC
jgi:hypothetical protein